MNARTTSRRSLVIQWGVFLAFFVILGGILAKTVSWGELRDSFLKWEVLRKQFPDIITEGARNTLLYTAIAFGLGLVFGLIAALMRQSSVTPARWMAASYIEFFRSIPAVLTILLVGYGVPIAFSKYDLPQIFRQTYGKGGLALGLVAGAYMAETIRAGIEAVPKGQTEAARSLGMTAGQTMKSVVLPQGFRVVIPPLTNEFVLLLKDTSLLYVLGMAIGERELTTFAAQARSATFNTTPLTAAAICYLGITLPLTFLVLRIERRAKAGSR